MKKIHKGKQQLLFALLSVFVLLSVCLLQSCQPDGKMVKSGTFGLRLSADTTSLNKGVNSDLKTKGYEDEFEEFLETSDYSILIVKDQKDTVQTFPRYDEMPAEIELAEGAYTLIASKGDNKGAAFENPYFEGSTDFTIRGDMNTYIDVTCTLGNSRIVVESTKEFNELYEDYRVILKTDYTSDEGFKIEKDETRPAFLRADKGGTEAEVTVEMLKKGDDEISSYKVPTKLKLQRRQNINIILKMVNSGGELGIEVVIDDTMEGKTETIDIPDNIWNSKGIPVLSWKDGTSESSRFVEIVNQEPTVENTDVSINFVSYSGFSSFIIKYTDGINSKEYDLNKNPEEATNAGITWRSEDLPEENPPLNKENGKQFVKTGTVDIWGMLKQLPVNVGDETYKVSVYAVSAATEPKQSDVFTLTVSVKQN